MGTKTLVIEARIIDDKTGEEDHKAVHSNSGLSSVDVCDIQDLLMNGVVNPLRCLARQKAEEKATGQEAGIKF